MNNYNEEDEINEYDYMNDDGDYHGRYPKLVDNEWGNEVIVYHTYDEAVEIFKNYWGSYVEDKLNELIYKGVIDADDDTFASILEDGKKLDY